MAIEVTERAAAHGWTMLDTAAIWAMLTASYFWELINNFGHLVMLVLAATYVVYGIIGRRLDNKRKAALNRRHGYH